MSRDKVKKARYDKEYRKKNRAKRLAQGKLHYQENRVVRLQQNKEWREKHPELMKAYKRKWYEANHSELQEKNKQWAKLNLERVREIKKAYKQRNPVETRLHCQARRAKTRGGKVVKEEIKNWHTKLCGICKTIIEAEYHIDHILPLSVGGLHVTENLQLAHPVCNMKKGNRIDIEVDHHNYPGQTRFPQSAMRGYR